MHRKKSPSKNSSTRLVSYVLQNFAAKEKHNRFAGRKTLFLPSSIFMQANHLDQANFLPSRMLTFILDNGILHMQAFPSMIFPAQSLWFKKKNPVIRKTVPRISNFYKRYEENETYFNVFQRCRELFESGGASCSVRGIICPPWFEQG